MAALLLTLLGLGCSSVRAPEPSPGARAAAREVAPLPRLSTDGWARGVLYFAIVDRYADGDPGNNRGADPTAKGAFHGGDLVGLTGRLDDLAELGITALWITPVVRNIPGFVTGAGFPDWGYHGYWADDFTALDPRFGTEEDLARLVEEAHRRGIRVLLDVVYNHVGYGSRYLRGLRTASWLRSPDRGTCGDDDLTQCLAGLPDLRTDLEEVREHLFGAHLGLAKRVGLDGFRLDTVKHVEHAFWQVHRQRTRAELDEGFFLLGEVWGGDAQVLDPWFAADEMDAGFDFGFQGNVLAFVQGRGRAVAFDRYLKSREGVRSGYLLSHFLSSHDVPGALHLLGGDRARFRLAALLQMTVAGLPMVYYGEEVGRPGGDWPENRSPMPWGEADLGPGRGLPRDEALRVDYRRLIAVRRAQPALALGRHESLLAEGDLLVFGRRLAESGERVVVAVNRSETAAWAVFPAPPGWEEGALEAQWGDADPERREGGEIALRLGPLAGAILTRRP